MREWKIEAPAKVNLFLDIISKRDDGYHNIETCFHKISLSDEITVRESTEFSFTAYGEYASLLGTGENLLEKVYRVFCEKTSFNSPISVSLKKNIPVGAGLGGGSSDAASFLKLLNEISGFILNEEEMKDLALSFGADVPFFLHGSMAWGSGIGEIITPYEKHAKGFVVLLYPNIHISTPKAYSWVTKEDMGKGNVYRAKNLIKEVLTLDNLSQIYYNVFERLAVHYEKRVSEAIDYISQLGLTPRMSGSGSTLYMLFDNEEKAKSVFGEISKAYIRGVYVCEFV